MLMNLNIDILEQLTYENIIDEVIKQFITQKSFNNLISYPLQLQTIYSIFDIIYYYYVLLLYFINKLLLKLFY